MKAFLQTLCIAFAGSCFYVHGAEYPPAIRPYAEFVEQCSTTPVDYVMGLFERYDVVILSERHHAEITQYDFINQLIADPRFAEQVGHVMTESGSYHLNERLNHILGSVYRDDSAAREQVLALIRDMYFRPLHTETNFYSLLMGIYQTNKGLDSSRKVKLYMTDVSFDWSETAGMTHEQYTAFYTRFMGSRDAVLAEHAVGELYKIFSRRKMGMPGKALIILNTRHAYRYFPNKWHHDMAAQYIMDRFPGRVANVMLHDCLAPSDHLSRDKPLHKGKWDAAFAACGNKAVGFDLAGTPFGADPFESIIKIRGDVRWQDMFTGYIFYRPFSEWQLCVGIEGVVPDAFVGEYRRRLAIFLGKEPDEVQLQSTCEKLNRVRCSIPYSVPGKMHRQIARHLQTEAERKE